MTLYLLPTATALLGLAMLVAWIYEFGKITNITRPLMNSAVVIGLPLLGITGLSAFSNQFVTPYLALIFGEEIYKAVIVRTGNDRLGRLALASSFGIWEVLIVKTAMALENLSDYTVFSAHMPEFLAMLAIPVFMHFLTVLIYFSVVPRLLFLQIFIGLATHLVVNDLSYSYITIDQNVLMISTPLIFAVLIMLVALTLVVWTWKVKPEISRIRGQQ